LFAPKVIKLVKGNAIRGLLFRLGAWGSNYPSSEGRLPELLKVARDSVACLPPADQEWIFAKTAQVLYPALVG